MPIKRGVEAEGWELRSASAAAPRLSQTRRRKSGGGRFLQRETKPTIRTESAVFPSAQPAWPENRRTMQPGNWREIAIMMPDP
jgi:hypothetical protein